MEKCSREKLVDEEAIRMNLPVMNRLRQMYRKKKLKSVQLKNKNKEKPGENPGFFYCTFVLKVVYIL